jgi:hypothetical protein
MVPRISTETIGRFLSTTEEVAKEEKIPMLGVGKNKTSTGLVRVAARARDFGTCSQTM